MPRCGTLNIQNSSKVRYARVSWNVFMNELELGQKRCTARKSRIGNAR